ncbi:MAG TPA: GNAT family N-acetyltransferase [Solirubrobacteraceae bacterium]
MSTSETRPVYPADREADIVLRDGSTVHVRPVRAEDRESVYAFLAGISQESIGFRFFAAANLKWATNWTVDVDYSARFGLVAETGSPSRIIAHGAYIGIDAERAEVAFLVADEWQGRGIATILLAHLADVAERHGFETFTAEVMPANHRMIQVFRESGFAVAVRSTRDAIKIEFPLSMAPEAQARFQERDRSSAVAAVSSVLRPRSLAVIGASRRRGTIGGELVHNVIDAGFTGALYVVNEHGGRVQTLEAYRSATELPEAVDLAVIAVPAARVLDAVRDCVTVGVRSLVIISAGFAELGEEGIARQSELMRICREAGIRVVGPNCLGVLNTAPEVGLNATFAPHQAAAGGIGFLSQSGGLGIAIIEAAARLGVGLSSFVSVGNKADLSGNDFLQYWEQDPSTDVALLYLESFGNPRKFARIARRVSRTMPVIAVKSGRSPAGARATASHTGALLAASDVTVEALFRQSGVIRTDTLAQMFDVATLLAKQPVPRGNRVAIVTNAGGPGIVCADACQAAGVQVPEPSAQLAGALAASLPAAASVANPIDMIASASASDYRQIIGTLIASGEFDAILTIFVPPLVTEADDVAAAIADAARTAEGCAVVAVFMTADGPPAQLSDGDVQVPGYQFPEEAAEAVALAARYGLWRERPDGQALRPAAPSVERGAAIISRALAAGADWMAPALVSELLACYGVPQVPTRLAADAEQAVVAAQELGLPVALKAVARGLLHKSDAGGVALGLDTEAAVRVAAQRMRASVTAAGHEFEGYLVQPILDGGVELLVGVVQDQSFGPVLACGAGGTAAEVLGDVSVRITPVTDLDAAEMLRSLKMFPLLEGYRGAPACETAAIEAVLLRVSAMVEAHPEILELDCNPLLALPDGVFVVDARIRVAEALPPVPLPSVGR